MRRKLDKIFNSSSSNSSFLAGIFFSKFSFIRRSKLYSIKSSLFFEVCAFLAILLILLSIISKSEKISSKLMTSISRIGSTFPST